MTPEHCSQAKELSVRQQRRDEVLALKVRSALAADCHHVLQTVDVQVHEGLVRLSGRVSRFYYKQLATSAVLPIQGVEVLHNDLEVVP